MRDRSPSNGFANLLMVLGFALLVMGGVSAYPSLRDALGAEATPRGFGDESALGAAIMQVNESLPPGASDARPTAEAAPVVLPETPLESAPTPEPTPAPEALPTEPPAEPTPTVEPTAAVPPTAAVQPTAIVAPTATPAGARPSDPSAPIRLVIPAIDLDAPVESVGWHVTTQNGQQVSMWDVPNRYAAGWLKTSARLGEPGNTVLDGHHNIAGEVFRDLVNLEHGDVIQVWSGDRLREYVVVMMKILPEKGQPISARLENAKWIMPTSDERVTLVTCWPYTNNTHRLVVVGLPADAPPPPDLGAE